MTADNKYIIMSLLLPLLIVCQLSSTVSASVWTTLKYQHFFPHHGWVPMALSSQTCAATLNEYLTNYTSYGTHHDATVTACYNHEACIFGAADAAQTNNWNTAQVLLGLTPTLLASLGPQLGEVSIMSTKRPVLSLLLSMGAGTVYPTRVFEYSDPNAIVKITRQKFDWLMIGPQRTVVAVLISALQYVIALGSVVNTLTLVIQLGTDTVESFDCLSYYYPVIWWLLAVLIHSLAAIPFILRQLEKNNTAVGPAFPHDRTPSAMPTMQSKVFKGTIKQQWRDGLMTKFQTYLATTKRYLILVGKAIQSEVTICANQPPSRKIKVSKWTIVLNCCGGVLGFAHIVFGTVVFSAMLFIMTQDAAICVGRFGASAICCRAVLVFELVGMSADGKDSGDDQI